MDELRDKEREAEKIIAYGLKDQLLQIFHLIDEAVKHDESIDPLDMHMHAAIFISEVVLGRFLFKLTVHEEEKKRQATMDALRSRIESMPTEIIYALYRTGKEIEKGRKKNG